MYQQNKNKYVEGKFLTTEFELLNKWNFERAKYIKYNKG